MGRYYFHVDYDPKDPFRGPGGGADGRLYTTSIPGTQTLARCQVPKCTNLIEVPWSKLPDVWDGYETRCQVCVDDGAPKPSMARVHA